MDTQETISFYGLGGIFQVRFLAVSDHRLLQYPHLVSGRQNFALSPGPISGLTVSTLNPFARATPATMAASVFRYSPKMRPKIGSKARKPALILRISFRRRHFLGRQSIPIPRSLSNFSTNAQL